MDRRALTAADGRGSAHPVLFSELVRAADAVAATRSRNAKVATLADVLRRLDPGEIPAGVALLAGEPRQGRIGIGWATLVALDVAPADEPALTVADVDGTLDALQGTVGPGSAGARAAILRDLLGRATAPEADFLRRLLVGEVRHGALEGVATDAVAAAAGAPAEAVRRALMLSGDLGRTAVLALTGGEAALRGVRLELMRAIKPMLASSAAGVAEALAGMADASVEWKLDGIRVQVHRSGPDVRVYTRNLNDITGRVPELVAVVRQLPAERLILDGEAILLDEDERPAMFQATMSRMGRGAPEQAAAASTLFFDCLHAEGKDLIDRPLAERLEALEAVAGALRVPAIVTTDVATADRFLDEALGAGHEGLMVKARDSTYQAGRRGSAWRKVKRARTLDLAVLGAEWGHGRRRGWLSNLHLGARGAGGELVMVGKTFKGLTDEMLAWQTERLLALETGREGIVVRVRPELVVEIELDGVQVSSRYPGGVALRFARVVRYRHDKGPADADTIDAVRALLPDS